MTFSFSFPPTFQDKESQREGSKKCTWSLVQFGKLHSWQLLSPRKSQKVFRLLLLAVLWKNGRESERKMLFSFYDDGSDISFLGPVISFSMGTNIENTENLSMSFYNNNISWGESFFHGDNITQIREKKKSIKQEPIFTWDSYDCVVKHFPHFDIDHSTNETEGCGTTQIIPIGPLVILKRRWHGNFGRPWFTISLRKQKMVQYRGEWIEPIYILIPDQTLGKL